MNAQKIFAAETTRSRRMKRLRRATASSVLSDKTSRKRVRVDRMCKLGDGIGAPGSVGLRNPTLSGHGPGVARILQTYLISRTYKIRPMSAAYTPSSSGRSAEAVEEGYFANTVRLVCRPGDHERWASSRFVLVRRRTFARDGNGGRVLGALHGSGDCARKRRGREAQRRSSASDALQLPASTR